MIAGIEMFLGVDGKQVGMEMTEYQMAANSIYFTSLATLLYDTLSVADHVGA